MARRRALKPALFVSSSTWCGSDLKFSGLIWLKFKALALYNISYPNLCLLACELSFTAKSKIWHSFTLCLTVSIHYVFSSHPHLLLPALLNEAEDDVDGVLGLLDDGRVQHVVPITAMRLQQQLPCIASSPEEWYDQKLYI